ncbi:Xylose isomerase [Klebsiella variicola]|uniref:Xylose isomerase n=1 Tax=Klebsiella variicola TaxID=244366 RepID=A0A7H4MCH0_KLEVA|nr:Xylose isomerase [Klebsiella variicola]
MPTAAMRSLAGIRTSSRTAVEENTLVMYEILKAGGFTTGGLNFDAKVRRQSTDKYDMFYGHIGAMDVMALSLKLAARMIEDGKLDQGLAKRYAGWQGRAGAENYDRADVAG